MSQSEARCSGLRIERVHPFPVRRKDWAYLPAALLLFGLTKLHLSFKRRPPADPQLDALLISRNLLLSDVLIVSLYKPPGV